MLDLKTLTFEGLMQKENLLYMEKEVDEIVLWQDIKRARKLLRSLEDTFKNIQSVPSAYLVFLTKLQWTLFETLSDMQAIEIIEKHLDIIVSMDTDVINVLKLHLKGMPYLEEEHFKEKISNILEKNEIQIANKKIKEWIIDYHSHVTSLPTDDITLARAEYFSSSKNFVKCKDDEKEKLKKIFSLYDFVNTSSLLPGGYAEDYIIKWSDGEMSLLDSGELKPIYAPPQKISVSRARVVHEEHIHAIRGAYQGKNSETEKIAKAESDIVKTIGSDYEKLRKEFYKAMQGKNIHIVIAILRILVSQKQLNNFLRQDEKLKKFLAIIWEEKGGKSLSEEFKKSPDSPKFIRLFLRYILEDRLKIPQGDAARLGAQLGNIYKKNGMSKYSALSYFDLEHKEFRWME